MNAIFDAIAARPWILAVMLASLVIWVTSIWIVVRSPKFLRKWLWVLLTFASFSFRWSVEANVTLGVGIPLGSLYILWFARYGPAPTPEAVAQRAKAIAATPSAGKVRTLRIAYAIATLAVLGMMAWLAFGPAANLFGRLAGRSVDMYGFMKGNATVGAVLFGGVFVFLAVRPYWWGKLLCAFAAVAWIFHGLIAGLMMSTVLPDMGISPAFYAIPPIAAGLVMLAVGIVHHRVDRRFGGSYLRAA